MSAFPLRESSSFDSTEDTRTGDPPASKGGDDAARLCRACRHMTDLVDQERTRARTAEDLACVKDRLLEIATVETQAVLEAIRVWTATLRQDVSSRTVREMAVAGLEHVLHGHAVLLGELLDASRLDKSRGQLDLSFVDFDTLVERAVGAMAAPANEAGVAITLAKVGEGELMVLADRTRLERAVEALLGQVLKSCARGGTVRVVLSRDAVMCLVHVATESAATTSSREDVALAGARSALRLHGGALEVRRRDGTFVAEMRVPRRGSELEGGGPPSREVLDGKKVVVFHSDADVAELVGILLRERGATMLLARDFASAALACDSYKPDVVLVGTEAEGERLRAAVGGGARVVVVTAPFDIRALVGDVARA